MAAGKYITMQPSLHYARTNAAEYWAEGVQWWFFSNHGECFSGSIKVESPEELEAYDPILCELTGRMFRTHRIEADVFHGRRIRPVTWSTTRLEGGMPFETSNQWAVRGGPPVSRRERVLEQRT